MAGNVLTAGEAPEKNKRRAVVARKFISKAIRRPGALRRKAGLKPGGDGKISEEKLASLKRAAEKRGDTRTLRQIALARTLKKMRKRKKAA